jgi:cell division protein FtsB
VRGATATQEIQQLSGELEALAENTNQVTARVAHLEKDSKGLKAMLTEKPQGAGKHRFQR